MHDTPLLHSFARPPPSPRPHWIAHVEPVQRTAPPWQELLPVQVIAHAPASHWGPWLQLVAPVQLNVQLAAEHATGPPWQALSEVQPIVQVPASQVTPLLHAVLPAQATSQNAPEHATVPPWQALGPVQRTTHAEAAVQSTPELHEALPAQSTAQGIPGGQTTLPPWQPLFAAHAGKVHHPPSQTPPSQPASQFAGFTSSSASGSSTTSPVASGTKPSQSLASGSEGPSDVSAPASTGGASSEPLRPRPHATADPARASRKRKRRLFLMNLISPNTRHALASAGRRAKGRS